MAPTVLQQLLLDGIREIKADIGDLRNNLSLEIKAIQSELTVFKLDHTKAHAEVDGRSRSAHERLDEHARQLETFNAQLQAINKLLPFLRVVAYIMTSLSGVLILSLLGFIWALLTHQLVIEHAWMHNSLSLLL